MMKAKSIKRAYIENGWNNDLVLVICKVKKYVEGCEDWCGEDWEDEDEQVRFSGFTSIEEATECAKEYKAKEIVLDLE